MKTRLIVSLAALFLPWPLRRWVLVHFLGYLIEKNTRIGWSLICPVRLEMKAGSRIGHLTFCKAGVERLHLGKCAIIGNLNWITGEPIATTNHFKNQGDRRPELIVNDHAAITNRHFVDCSATISIGRFSTVAGIRSAILTHSIDLNECVQKTAAITIGEYCFVGAMCLFLPGAALPDRSVLGANSLLNKQYTEPFYLYAGSPARPVKQLEKDSKYFTRDKGFVD